MSIMADGPNDRLPSTLWVAVVAGLSIFAGPLLFSYFLKTVLEWSAS